MGRSRLQVFHRRPTLQTPPKMRNQGDMTVMIRWLAIFRGVFWMLGGGAALLVSLSAQKAVDFDSEIAPILTTRCLECHSGPDPEQGLDLSSHQSAMKGGQGGLALVAHDLENSLLWRQLESDEMPPENPLSESEKALFRRWILDGAQWGKASLSRFGKSSEKRAGSDWWSLQPVRRPVVPNLETDDWSLNPIDSFVSRKRSELGLKPSEPAPLRTLIRRISFDLLGLPPDPNDVERLLQDPSRRAYEEWVERLLVSPELGERWARHWLDIARFGESQGFERDHIRLHSWRYRDWVVNALNQNLPYNEFARMQLAGDVLSPQNSTGIVATGFLVAGAYDVVGQSQQSAAMRAVVRQDEMEDYVSTVGQTFLGLTVHCARCHDHKFDPILQREYYQLAASLAGVRPGERTVREPALLNRFDSRVANAERRLIEDAQPFVDQIVAARRLAPPATSGARPLLEIEGDHLETKAGEALRVRDGVLWFDEGASDLVFPGSADLTEKSVHISFALFPEPRRKQRVISFATLDGSIQESLWLDAEGGIWMQYQEEDLKRIGAFDPKPSSDLIHHLTFVFGNGDKLWVFSNGQAMAEPFFWRKGVKYSKNAYEIRLSGTTQSKNEPKGQSPFGVKKLGLYNGALTPREVAELVGVTSEYVSEPELQESLEDDFKKDRNDLIFELEQLRSQRTRLSSSRAYAVTPKKPEPVHLLKRGNPASPGDLVQAAGIASIQGLNAEFGLSDESSDGARRIALANWISDPANPLFARVIVNRLWFYHFGAGLVPTPSDFGFSAGKPSHPDLLDWLAAELVDRNWDLKAIHRLILTSATYRQSSMLRKDAFAVDADNRSLWRMNPKRLEAEGLRDAILAVSGLLNSEMGGPGYQDFSTYVHNSQFYEMLDPIGETFHRRSLYRMWIRSGRSPFLDVFDCPDPSATAPKRAVTTTPLQALTLMNNSFVLRMADALSERMKRLKAEGLGGEVEQAFRWCFGRKPSQEEMTEAQAVIESHGRSVFARALLNSSELLYVD